MLDSLESEVVEGGWRSLCIGVLLQAVQRVEASSKLFKPGAKVKMTGSGGMDKELLKQRTQAREWFYGRVGLVTFEDCCEAMGVEPDRTREKIMQWCEERKREPPFMQRGAQTSLTKWASGD